MKRLAPSIAVVLAMTLAGCHAAHRGAARVHDAAPTRVQESQQEKDEVAQLTAAMESDLARTQQTVQTDSAGELDFSAMNTGTAGTASDTVGAALEPVGPREVTAEVEKIDRDNNQVVFYVKTTVQDIELQAGRELVVPFDQLPEITGADTAEDAVDTLPEGTDVRAWVSGVGDAMKITRIEPEPAH